MPALAPVPAPAPIAHASNDHELRSFAPYVPSVDARGRVAFEASLEDGSTAVFVGDGTTPPVRLACDGAWREHDVISHPAIGPTGVAWYARRGSEEALLFHDGETLRALVETGAELTSIGPLGPSIDEQGAVGFRASRGERSLAGVAHTRGECGVEVLDDPSLVRFTGLPVLGSAVLGSAAGGLAGGSSDSALIARADSASGASLVVRARAGTRDVVLSTDGEIVALGAFVCADRHRIACSVRRADGSEALVEKDGSGLRVIAETGPRWESLRGVLVAGEHIVFYATPRRGSLGVYVGREAPVRIAGLGDPAFGAAVSDLALNPVSIHRDGWLAMRLGLDDGTERIVRFDLLGAARVDARSRGVVRSRLDPAAEVGDPVRMDADPFDELDFFAAIAKSGARVVLIGRRALIALGLPVLTSDYDLWIDVEGAERLNAAVAHLDLVPNRTVEEARKVGRYVLENGERVDVLIAKQVSTVDGVHVRFEEVYARARVLTLSNGATLRVPTTEDLILTKRFASRAKDIADIRLLETLAAKERGET